MVSHIAKTTKSELSS